MRITKDGVEIDVEILKIPKTHKENLLEKKEGKIVNQRKEIKKLLQENWLLKQRISKIKHFLNWECKRI